MTRRTKPRAYLLLARVSNLPTVWTNVLAGSLLTGVALQPGQLIGVAAAMSLIYCAGMWMNDACDAVPDARARADRPIPNGDVSRSEVWIGTVALMAGGLAVLWWSGADAEAWRWMLALVAAITYYNVRHKVDPFGPLAMGLCRGLLYVTAAAAAAGAVGSVIWVGAAVLVLYVLGLTLVGKTLGPRAGGVMPWLIAGISVVDAVVIVTMSPVTSALWVTVALAGFFATLAAQRVVPGT